MRQPTAVIEELDDWEVLCSFLPEGWEGKAREYGALVRARGVADAPALLRTLLIHMRRGVRWRRLRCGPGRWVWRD